MGVTSYTIQNVVASASLFVDVPLEKLATKLINTEYIGLKVV